MDDLRLTETIPHESKRSLGNSLFRAADQYGTVVGIEGPAGSSPSELVASVEGSPDARSAPLLDDLPSLDQELADVRQLHPKLKTTVDQPREYVQEVRRLSLRYGMQRHRPVVVGAKG